MIHNIYTVISPSTFALLTRIMRDTRLNDFVLVGGTALALQIGHRLSVDLDLFTQKDFSNQELAEHLSETYTFSTDYVAHNTLKGFVENVKCDFIAHKYAYSSPILIENGIRLASLLDIAALKLNAIAHNGTRYKDFIDMYFLLEQYSLEACLDAFSRKYPTTNPIVALKGLGYFEDINFEFDTPILLKPLAFGEVKQRLLAAMKQPKRVFGA